MFLLLLYPRYHPNIQKYNLRTKYIIEIIYHMCSVTQVKYYDLILIPLTWLILEKYNKF